LLHHDSHDRVPRPTRLGAGGRRYRRGLGSEDRVARDLLQGARHDPGAAARGGDGTMILVIDNYDSFTYHLVQYLGVLRATLEVVRNDAMTCEAISAPKPEPVVISPGPGHPAPA